MHKRILFAFAVLVSFASTALAQQDPVERLNQLLSNQASTVFVAAHRGDWRDAPENSIQSLLWASTLGVDIVELDLKRTKDGSLVLMHDATVDRTSTGHGLVSDLTLDDLKQLKLRAGTGHPTRYGIPTFSEELQAARENHVILDIDTAWDYSKDAMVQVRLAKMTQQVILNVFHNTTLKEVEGRIGRIPDDVTIMEVVDLQRPDAETILRSYAGHRRTILQVDFNDATDAAVNKIPEYRKATPIWMNGLWPNQNGGHDDDTALDPGPPDQSWGWLIAKGANVLQTDRPRELLEYLQKRHLRWWLPIRRRWMAKYDLVTESKC